MSSLLLLEQTHDVLPNLGVYLEADTEFLFLFVWLVVFLKNDKNCTIMPRRPRELFSWEEIEDYAASSIADFSNFRMEQDRSR